jgi:Cu2+-containing amine oxidase
VNVKGDDWLNEPNKDELLLNSFVYSLFASIDATILMYSCTDAELGKSIKKKRAAFMRTLKWITKYHEMTKGLDKF